MRAKGRRASSSSSARPACSTPISIRRAGGGEAVVTHVDARLPDGRDMDRAACVAALTRGARRAELRQRPARRLRHHRVLVAVSRSSTGTSSGRPLLPAAIAALRTIRFRPIRLIGEPAKTLRKPASSSASRSASARRGQLGAGQEGLVGARRVGEAVPRADREAIVAAIDAVADRRPEFLRDRPLMLDREIGDAAPRIEPERAPGRRRSGRRRGRRVQLPQRIGMRRVRLELQRRVDRAEEQPAAVACG